MVSFVILAPLSTLYDIIAKYSVANYTFVFYFKQFHKTIQKSIKLLRIHVKNVKTTRARGAKTIYSSGHQQ